MATTVSQLATQVLHGGAVSDGKVSQLAVQVLSEAPTGILFQDGDCTDLASKATLEKPTATGLSWALLDSNDGSAVTAILDQNNNFDLYEGEGFIQTDAAPGTYIVIVQQVGTGNIGAYIRTVI